MQLVMHLNVIQVLIEAKIAVWSIRLLRNKSKSGIEKSLELTLSIVNKDVKERNFALQDHCGKSRY